MHHRWHVADAKLSVFAVLERGHVVRPFVVGHPSNDQLLLCCLNLVKNGLSYASHLDLDLCFRF